MKIRKFIAIISVIITVFSILCLCGCIEKDEPITENTIHLGDGLPDVELNGDYYINQNLKKNLLDNLRESYSTEEELEPDIYIYDNPNHGMSLESYSSTVVNSVNGEMELSEYSDDEYTISTIRYAAFDQSYFDNFLVMGNIMACEDRYITLEECYKTEEVAVGFTGLFTWLPYWYKKNSGDLLYDINQDYRIAGYDIFDDCTITFYEYSKSAITSDMYTEADKVDYSTFVKWCTNGWTIQELLDYYEARLGNVEEKEVLVENNYDCGRIVSLQSDRSGKKYRVARWIIDIGDEYIQFNLRTDSDYYPIYGKALIYSLHSSGE